MNAPKREAALPGSRPPAEISQERRSAVNRARESWIRRLIDLSRRNNLLYFRDLKTGTLDFSNCDPEGRARLLRGESVSLDRLLPDAHETTIAARMQEIRRRALSNLEEKGIETLFLVFGMATWPSVDEGRPAEAAVLLVPVGIEKRGREGREFALRRTGEVQVNPVLLHVLDIEHGCSVAPEALLEAAGNVDEDQAFNPEAVFAALTEAAAKIRGLSIKPRMVLGNFSFQKMAMVKDLREQAEQLAGHDLVAAIAGDAPAREAVRGGQTSIDPQELDRKPPEQEFTILDADSSQQRVIAVVLAGQDGVIQGPPGTGKSQTITNLVAELAARGRRVLFVAEKRAALEVVLRRLDENNLKHLALDLHGADITRRQIMQQIATSLELVRETPPVSFEESHARFADRRKRLNEHVARLHTARAPSGLSVYELQGRLLCLPAEAKASTRWRGTDLDRLDAVNAAAVRDLLVEAGGFSGLFMRNDPSPWTGANLPDGATVQQAMDLAARVTIEHLPALRESIATLTASTGLRQPSSLDEAGELVGLVRDVADTLGLYPTDIFRRDPEPLARALEPASRGLLATALAWCFDAEFRRARRALRTLRRDQRVRTSQLYMEVTAAAHQLRRWQALAGPEVLPCVAPGLDIVTGIYAVTRADLDTLAGRLGRTDIRQLRFDLLANLLRALCEDRVTPQQLPRLLEIERVLAERGVGALVTELRARKPEPSVWADMFQQSWLSSCMERALAEDLALAGFQGRVHDRFVEEFCRLDRERLQLAIGRARRAHAERAVGAMNAHAEQAALVRREAAKKTRHLSLRRLLGEAPDVLTALRPCWMASPLSVSQLLPADRRYFDVVLFDEASQVLPEDAVPALLRSVRAVVAGDRHQLPPTPFFVAGEGEEIEDEAAAPSEGFESVLDLLSSFLDPWELNWHYRSHDEALIAFSNRHIYGNRLVTFPGPGRSPALSHVLVPHVLGKDGEEESASPEVEKVVQLVLHHATERPSETFGVITMGLPHARRVQAALDRALQVRPELGAFFDESRHERFFVKNIERVQGDERDAIILSVGYGKDRSGRLLYQFGPLLYEGGERRLNVAITRARVRGTLVSSFDHHDMDPSRSKSRGVELLRLYLEYAASGGLLLGDVGRTSVPLNYFEQSVNDALTAKGMSLLPQWGASQYRIDLVAQHPVRAGRSVLAIECDGASYHSAPTARDRDRLRQQHLQALGWRFHRIWSTDWFMRRAEEIERALRTFREAVAYADRADAEGNCDPPVGPDSSQKSESRAANRGAAAPSQRGLRPPVPKRDTIHEYRQRELVELIRWIQSDGRLLTDEEIMREMVKELGFARCGSQIEMAIRSAIMRARETAT